MRHFLLVKKLFSVMDVGYHSHLERLLPRRVEMEIAAVVAGQYPATVQSLSPAWTCVI